MVGDRGFQKYTPYRTAAQPSDDTFGVRRTGQARQTCDTRSKRPARLHDRFGCAYGLIWVPSAFLIGNLKPVPAGNGWKGYFAASFSSISTANPRRLVEVHISLLHLRAARENLLNYLAPTKIYILLNAEIRYRKIHMALGCMVYRVDVPRAVP